MLDLFKVFNIVGPSLVAILVVYITYRYGIKQKKFEAKEDYYKKLRVSISNLLIIWKEITNIQRFLKDPDPSNQLVYYIPQLTKRFLKIDQPKIDLLRASYEESLNSLKEIDASLYFNLIDILTPFNRTINEIMIPILDDKFLTKKKRSEIIIPLLDETISYLEEEILKATKNLPKREKDKIEKIIDKHNQTLSKPSESEAPPYLLNLLNRLFVEPLTADEFKIFYENPTILWALRKVISSNPKYIDIISNPVSFFQILSEFKNPNSPIIRNLNNELNDYTFFKKLKITRREEQLHFVKNKEFARLALGMLVKVNGVIPFSFKRIVAQIYTGQLSIRIELENYKSQLEIQQLLSEFE